MKKALFISDHGDPLAKLGGVQAGGQNNYVRQLALALEKEGWHVDVMTHWSEAAAPQIEPFGNFCRVVRIEAGKKGFVSKNEMVGMVPAMFEEMEQVLDLSEYDIIHTHYWISGLLGRMIRKKYGIPFVHTSHSLGVAKEEATGFRDETRHIAESLILSSANEVVATTDKEKELIQKFVKNPTEISVLPIGVSASFKPRHQRSSLRKQLGYSGPMIAYAGRLEETKGVETLMKAIRMLVKVGSIPEDTKLVLAGGQEEEIDFNSRLPHAAKLRKWVKGIEDYVEFLGPKNQDELAVLFNAATVTVVPSYYESFGMVAAEAQACGSPVIASRVGGLQNVVIDGETGLLVTPKDPEDLANAIEAILTNNLLAQRMGKQAIELARNEFQWSNIAKRMDRLYEEVLVYAKTLEGQSSSGYGFGRNLGW